MEQTMSRNSDNAVVLRNVACWCLIGLFVFCIPLVGDLIFVFVRPQQFRDSVEDPASEFTRYTKLKWPEGAAIVSVGDDHGGLQGDGEFHLVFDADKEILKRWLESSTSWGDPEWKDGPIPEVIADHCFISVKHGTTYQKGLAQSQIRYCAEDFKHSDIPWHNGRVLAIDPVAGRVYLSWWDF